MSPQGGPDGGESSICYRVGLSGNLDGVDSI